ncbi:MAG TPA: LytTR family DNA-binding domain-containing protein [Cyclobacteriaceae bacterium]|nr:LytTR family DNA-binding domain-containing protein [Cyclobacteriaceae bacterium]
MKILIIEDEPHAAARLKELVTKVVPRGNVLGSIDSVKSAVGWFKTNSTADLVLMDIQLADGLSFEIFDQVKVSAPVIFTTAYDEYALKAFKVNSIDYLLKPIDEDDFRNAMQKFETLRQPNDSQQLLERIGNAVQMFSRNYKERFVTKVGEHLRFINTTDILFFYSADKITFGRTTDGRNHILDYTLDQVEGLVDPDHYFRINRKYIIRVEAINDMISHVNSRLKLVLKTSDDNDVIVARERLADFRNWIDR